MVAETGWLVEKSPVGSAPPLWWSLTGPNGWTPDSTKALRFAHHQDAAAYIDHHGWTGIAIATEHQWGF